MNTSLPPAQRAKLLLAAMSLDEELALVRGTGEGTYVGQIPANTTLGIPALNLEDGPAGVADGMTGVTTFPAPITIAASWDTALAMSFGSAIGQEQVGKGTNVVLAPMMNMDRIPVGGRNFEGFGEDPTLASAMAAAVVRGIQGEGLVATAKHYIDNDQETNRMSVSSVIDDRTQHEIYLPPFVASVDAGVGAVMCSYNQVNGVYACENDATLGLLKQGLGFQGWVMSDWDATHSTVAAAMAGLDMEMPDDTFFGAALTSAVASGQVPKARVDDMVTRILTSSFAAGLFDRAPTGSAAANVQTTAHTELARSAGAQGTVLLRNSGPLLPLSAATVHSIAVLGAAGSASPIFQGLGSSQVHASSVVTPLQGLTTRAGRAGAPIAVSYAQGTTAPFDDGTTLAAAADVAVVVVGTTSSEGADRSSTSLPGTQDALVEAVARANPRTIVVVYAPAQVLMPWANQVAAILFAGLPGQEEGDALADVVFGDVNPSGKLPFTLAANEADYPVATPATGETAEYSEGFLVGYRWFDATGPAPLFPFGHGLSYATFGYANLEVSPASVPAGGAVDVTFDVTNTGSVAGSEVAQLYLGLPSETSEPPAQLEAFQKVTLAPGAAQHVSLHVAASAYSFWSAGLQGPAAYPGTHGVSVGSSSRDIRLKGSFDVTGGQLAGVFQQAEEAAVCCGASASSAGTGFTGSGFVDGLTAQGAAVTFSVAMPTAGPCAITARYSAAHAPGTLSLEVNGKRLKDVTFPALANLSTWDFETETVSLQAGANTVAYVDEAGDNGGVVLDGIIGCAAGADGGAGATGTGSEPAEEVSISGAGCGCRTAPASGDGWRLIAAAAAIAAIAFRRRP